MSTAYNSGELQRFELVERIAVGGMAEVFKAKSYGPHGFQKILAVKRILPELATEREFIDRFVVEAKIAAGLSHANIVQVLDFSRFGESLYIAMEFVDGVDLATLLREYRRREDLIPVPVAMHIAVGMLRGLGAAHRQGVVHRDVSPSNVLLSRSGDVKITDFGIAKAAAGGSGHTRPFNILGKWRYMSPEQALGDELDTRSDVFSAGVVLFELFSGRRLFNSSEIDGIDRQRRAAIPSLAELRSEIPPALDTLLAKMLQPEVEFRHVTCEQILSELNDLSYEISSPDAGLQLATLVRDYLEDEVEDAEDSGSVVLIDQIINSELERHKEPSASRITMASTSQSLSFVSDGEDANGIKRWTLVGDEGEPFDSVLDGLLGDNAEAPGGAGDRRVTEAATPIPALAASADTSTSDPPVRTEQLRSGTRLGFALLVLLIGGAMAFGGWWVLEGRRANEQLGGGSATTDASSAPSIDAAGTKPELAGPVRVTSEPGGATIYIDGDSTGLQTPSDVEVSEPRESVPIMVKLEGFLDCEMRARTSRSSGKSIAHCNLQEVGVTLVVTSAPEGAEVFLDGQSLGTTPLEVQVPATGKSARLKFQKKGRRAQSAEVSLISGRRTKVFRKLRRR